jgi:hypothetical protein
MTRKETTMKNAYCHEENVCLKQQRDVAHHAEEESEDEYALITGVNRPKIVQDENNENKGHDDIWIGDTGATCHMKNSKIGLLDKRPCEGIVDAAIGW